jgi:uncharacterized caspase-like protein
LSLVAVAAPQAANAAARVALVIGNSAYQRLPKVAKGVNDAAAMAALLRKAGYTVKEANNLGFFAFKDAIYAFKSVAREAEVAVIYFSGHGIGVDGNNYLLPIDARLTSDDDAAREGINLDSILSAFPSAIQLGLVILDASHARPLVEVTWPASGAVARNSGARPVGSLPGNLMVASSAKPGSTTKDGNGPNSPYTAALLKHLAQSDLEIARALARVHDDVVASTKSKQEPVVYGGGNATTLRAFINKLPDALQAADARARLDALERAAKEREAAAAREAAEQHARMLEYEQARAAAKQETQPPAPPSKEATVQRPPAPAPASAVPPRSESIDHFPTFPTIAAVERVAPGVKTTVLVSLTAEKVTPAVVIGATGGGAKRAPGGALSVPMPPERERIPLTVILHAPGFDLDPGTPQQATIELDREGDSTVARFDITARPDELGPHVLRVTFWREGEFLASASRKIERQLSDE